VSPFAHRVATGASDNYSGKSAAYESEKGERRSGSRGERAKSWESAKTAVICSDLLSEGGRNRPYEKEMSMLRTVPLLLLICLVLGSSVATAQKAEVTPFVGYRFGGNFYDNETGNEIDLKNSVSYGFTFDYALSDNILIEFLYSRQGTELSVVGGESPVLELDVDYMHGGILFQGGSEGLKPYVVAGLGAARFNPKESESNSQSRFSIGLGAGVKGLFSERVGYRFEFRSIPTFIDKSQQNEFCPPSVEPLEGTSGCYTWTTANVFWQSQFTGGVTIAF
jgi:hypothetical protein